MLFDVICAVSLMCDTDIWATDVARNILKSKPPTQSICLTFLNQICMSFRSYNLIQSSFEFMTKLGHDFHSTLYGTIIYVYSQTTITYFQHVAYDLCMFLENSFTKSNDIICTKVGQYLSQYVVCRGISILGEVRNVEI